MSDLESTNDLESARKQIAELDRQIIETAAKRVELARDVARFKREAAQPTVDFTQERDVMERARTAAEQAGLATDVAEDLVSRLVEETVTVQEGESLRLAGGGAGRSAVVVGGGGRMGRWFVGFLANQGFQVNILDPEVPQHAKTAKAMLPDADLVIMAAPPTAIAMRYMDWTDEPPKGILIDIASVKEPLLAAVKDLQKAGARVASIHPMFGPDAKMLRDHDVVICDTGDEEAMQAARELFEATTAHIVEVPLEEHDMWMADVLALAHATALSFAHSLPETPRPVRSSTLGALEDLAWHVVQEAPEVYFEIQARNPHALQSVDRLARSVQQLARIVQRDKSDQFRKYVEAGRHNLSVQRGGED